MPAGRHVWKIKWEYTYERWTHGESESFITTQRQDMEEAIQELKDSLSKETEVRTIYSVEYIGWIKNDTKREA